MRFLLENWKVAHMILKKCSMLKDTYNAQKIASIIYLGLLITRTKKQNIAQS